MVYYKVTLTNQKAVIQGCWRNKAFHVNFKTNIAFDDFRYSTSGEVVIKGVIAKKIPAFVNLKKDKTYSWCSCGLSKKQPFCDGSHKDHPQKLQPVKFTASKDGKVLLCRCKQTNNRPYCDLTHIKTFIPEGVRKMLNIKL